jgi:carbohydrate diacid regulator
LNRDVHVIDEKKQCVASPDSSKIGSIVKLPDYVDELSSPKQYELDGHAKVVIPLRYKSKNVAYILFDEGADEITNYSLLIKSFAELLVQQYYENNKPILDPTDNFIIELFENYNPNDNAKYEAEAKVLGYDLSKKRLAISVYLNGFWDNCLLDLDQPSFERDQVIKNWKRNLEQSINSFFTKNADLLIAYVGNDRFVIFKSVEGSDEESIKKMLKKSYRSIFEPLKNHRIKSITVGFGNAYDGIDGLINSRREADLTIELGQRIWGENQSYYFGELGLLSILGDGDRNKKIEFSNTMLAKLRNEELNKTLESFFDNNLNLTETAEEMGIHRNTVIYRLNQITKVLGADPRIFEQAMSIKIALIIKSLFG